MITDFNIGVNYLSTSVYDSDVSKCSNNKKKSMPNITDQLSQVIDDLKRKSSPKCPPPLPPAKSNLTKSSETFKPQEIESGSHIEIECSVNSKMQNGIHISGDFQLKKKTK